MERYGVVDDDSEYDDIKGADANSDGEDRDYDMLCIKMIQILII